MRGQQGRHVLRREEVHVAEEDVGRVHLQAEQVSKMIIYFARLRIKFKNRNLMGGL